MQIEFFKRIYSFILGQGIDIAFENSGSGFSFFTGYLFLNRI